MMTLSEGVTLFIAAGVFAVVWWGVKAIVNNSALNTTAIAGINTSIATINGRLDNSEQMAEQHRVEDRDKFRMNEEDHKELWHAINHPR